MWLINRSIGNFLGKIQFFQYEDSIKEIVEEIIIGSHNHKNPIMVFDYCGSCNGMINNKYLTKEEVMGYIVANRSRQFWICYFKTLSKLVEKAQIFFHMFILLNIITKTKFFIRGVLNNSISPELSAGVFALLALRAETSNQCSFVVFEKGSIIGTPLNTF